MSDEAPPPLHPLPAADGNAHPRAIHSNSARPYMRTSAAAFEEEEPIDPDDPLLGFTPYMHVAPRRNSITPDRQRAFIAELAACGIVTQAARKIGASLESLYKLRNRYGAEDFAAAWEDALDRGVARLEDCALTRALEGEEQPLIYHGEVVGSWKKHDNTLLMFLLRQRRRQRYATGDRLADLRPGHPVYERLRREWEDDERAKKPSQEEIYESIRRKIALVLEREEAFKQMQREEAEAAEAARTGESSTTPI